MIDEISGGLASAGNTAGRAAMREGANAFPHGPHPTSGHPLPLPQARGKLVPNPKARLKEQFHEVCRFKHLAVRSEEAYWGWVVRLLVFHREKAEKLKPEILKAKSKSEGWINPRDLNGEQLGEFLSHLASVGKVAASTQNQALNALMFLYREVLHEERAVAAFERVRRPARLPEVLSRNEVNKVLAAVAPEHQLPLQLLYGTGMRLMVA